jgi:hypothetical protein
VILHQIFNKTRKKKVMTGAIANKVGDAFFDLAHIFLEYSLFILSLYNDAIVFLRFFRLVQREECSIPFSLSVALLVYMSCRSYTFCRSYNFDKIFAEVTTSTNDIVEVITSTIIFAEVITSTIILAEV